jgi:hypothetical protein
MAFRSYHLNRSIRRITGNDLLLMERDEGEKLKTGIFFGSSSGHTENIAIQI